MKKTTALIISLSLSFIFAFSSGCVSAGNNSSSSSGGEIVLPEIVTNKTYNSFWMKQFDYKTMPIAAYNGAPQKTGDYSVSMITESHYKAVAESGINTVYGLYERAENNPEEIKAALKLCEKYNLSYVAVGNGLGSFTDIGLAETSLYRSLIKDKSSALGGLIVKDEPNEKQFLKITQSRQILRELFGKKYLYHSNLYPNYATNAQLFGGDDYPADYSYEQYVENYCKTYAPQILSYDFYPVHTTYISPDYYVNMSVIREYAAKYEIPFWTYIQCSSFRKDIKVPDAGELRWLVNSSLAYGCKGLQYFTYVDALSSGTERFKGSPIDKNGNKTVTYDYISEINKYVAKVDEILMCSFSKGVMIAGETPCKIPEKDVISSYGGLTSVNGESVLVGCFDYKGKNAYYVVNNSLSQNTTAKLTFFSDVKATCFTLKSDYNTSGKMLSLNLTAGEGVLIVLN